MERTEWLQWRKKGIGSSDAPVVMGVSPWRTPLQLWEEKTSEETVEDVGSFITDRGNQVEPKVRALFELLTGRSYEVMIVQSEEFTFIRASLDGANRNEEGVYHSIVEIKLSGKEDYEGALAGKVPEKYMPQIQHQLMVTGAPVCYYLSYKYEKGVYTVTPDNLAIVEVRPDFEYQAELLSKEIAFWDLVTSKKSPPVGEKDYKQLSGVSQLVKEYQQLKAELEIAEANLDAVKQKILERAEESSHPRLKCAGMKIFKTVRQGNVNYKNIPELKGVDLEKYRGKSSTYWTIKEDKNV